MQRWNDITGLVALAALIAGCPGEPETGDTHGSSANGSEGCNLEQCSVDGTAGTATSTSGPGSGGGSQGASSSPGTAATTSASTGDPCDCMVGADVPMCGVDGMTYDAACGIECVPVEIACPGPCPCPTLMCGEVECPPDEPVCTTLLAGPAGVPPSYSCGPLPKACQGIDDPSCDCFQRVGCDCAETFPDLFDITCAAP